MADIGDYYSKFVKGFGDFTSGLHTVGSKAANMFVPGPAGKLLSQSMSNASDFYKNEISNKSDLRSSQVLGALSGFPIIGGLINGFQGAIQMEDLYNRTGKTAAYPGVQSLGTGGFGSAAAQALRIADGSNDLYRYYAGEPDQWEIKMFG